jgi:transposase InsO family protein
VEENFCVYGARKTWRQLNRERMCMARCTVERLMLQMRLQAARRGEAFKTSIPDLGASRPPDLVDRQFVATRPNQSWVADFICLAPWPGFVFVAFVIDVYSRMIVGWRVSRTATAELALDALEQALHAGRRKERLIHHSDRGSQHLSIRYTERLSECGIQASVGRTGDSRDNAPAETINGLCEAEVNWRRGPRRSLEPVEHSTLEWVERFDNRRLLAPIGDVPPADLEHAYCLQQESVAKAA